MTRIPRRLRHFYGSIADSRGKTISPTCTRARAVVTKERDAGRKRCGFDEVEAAALAAGEDPTVRPVSAERLEGVSAQEQSVLFGHVGPHRGQQLIVGLVGGVEPAAGQVDHTSAVQFSVSTVCMQILLSVGAMTKHAPLVRWRFWAYAECAVGLHANRVCGGSDECSSQRPTVTKDLFTKEVTPMATAREIMTAGATYCAGSTTAADAARTMAEEGIGALPVCDTNGRLSGVITDRDLALKVVAEGRDPVSVRVDDLLEGTEVVTIGADDSAEEAIRTMKDHAVRRLPVIDGTTLVGMVSQADIARTMPDAKIGDLVDAISSAPPNG
jgi:CBS domain-containing protein